MFVNVFVNIDYSVIFIRPIFQLIT